MSAKVDVDLPVGIRPISPVGPNPLDLLASRINEFIDAGISRYVTDNKKFEQQASKIFYDGMEIYKEDVPGFCDKLLNNPSYKTRSKVKEIFNSFAWKLSGGFIKDKIVKSLESRYNIDNPITNNFYEMRMFETFMRSLGISDDKIVDFIMNGKWKEMIDSIVTCL